MSVVTDRVPRDEWRPLRRWVLHSPARWGWRAVCYPLPDGWIDVRIEERRTAAVPAEWSVCMSEVCDTLDAAARLFRRSTRADHPHAPAGASGRGM